MMPATLCRNNSKRNRKAGKGGSTAGKSKGGGRSAKQEKKTKEKQDNSDCIMDMQKIVDGTELRSTLMVRNIPNKYTQQLLLEDFNTEFKVRL